MGFEPDGVSLVEFFKGGPAPKRDCFYWELHERRSIQAIRWGDWKAVRSQQGGPVELYDLAKDLGETADLAREHPDLVKKAISMMNEARSADLDWPDPTVQPKVKRKGMK